MSGQSLGFTGETLAREFLEDRGYFIVHANWRSGRLGEIDLVAYLPEKQLLAFVEVKTRTHPDRFHPLEAVTPAKQQKIRQLAEVYLQTPFAPDIQVQQISFDVVTVCQQPNAAPEVTHYPQAF